MDPYDSHCFESYDVQLLIIQCRPNLVVRGSSAITEEVKYEYSYSLYCIHVPES